MLSPACSRATSDARLRRFVVLVQAGGAGGDGVAGEQVSRSARVFGGDQRHFPQDPQRPGRDVFEVADRRGDHEQRAGHERTVFIVPLADRESGCSAHWRPITAVGAMSVSEPLPHFVDDLLGYLHETHPTHATLDGVHTHDDLLEDLSRHGDRRRGARPLRLSPPARRDRPRRLTRHRAARAPDARRRTSAAGCSSSRRSAPGRRTRSSTPTSWRRAWPARRSSRTRPAPERARRVLSKLRQTPRLIQAARDNIKEPPGIFVKVGIETMRGTLKFIDDDLPRALRRASTICTCSATSPTRRPKRRRRSAPTSSTSRPTSRRKARGVVPARARQVRAEGQARRRHHAAGRPAAGDRHARAAGDAGGVQNARRPHERRRSARGLGEAPKPSIRRPGELVNVGREQLEELKTFLERQSIVTMPAGEPITVAPTPEFYRWSFASMWTPGPVREQADARLLLPDRRRSVMADRAPGGAPARLQLPDAVVDLDPRGLPGPLPALPAPAAGRRRRCASRPCSRRRRSSKAGRTTASR